MNIALQRMVAAPGGVANLLVNQTRNLDVLKLLLESHHKISMESEHFSLVLRDKFFWTSFRGVLA